MTHGSAQQRSASGANEISLNLSARWGPLRTHLARFLKRRRRSASSGEVIGRAWLASTMPSGRTQLDRGSTSRRTGFAEALFGSLQAAPAGTVSAVGEVAGGGRFPAVDGRMATASQPRRCPRRRAVSRQMVRLTSRKKIPAQVGAAELSLRSSSEGTRPAIKLWARPFSG